MWLFNPFDKQSRSHKYTLLSTNSATTTLLLLLYNIIIPNPHAPSILIVLIHLCVCVPILLHLIEICLSEYIPSVPFVNLVV